jgi:centromeric protein E
MRPTDSASAWESVTFPSKGVKLFPQYAKSSATPPQEFHFDEILTGSDNKPVYNAVARSHVAAAMDGYNAVVFAYGQTASGKTFTLVGDRFSHDHYS